MNPRIGVLLSMVTLAACADVAVSSANVPPIAFDAPAPEDGALVCVMRATVVGFALVVPVRDNGNLVGATDGTGWFCYIAEPGEHRVEVEVSDADGLQFEARPGAHVYIEQVIRVGEDNLERIDATRAAKIASDRLYSVVESGPDGETLPAVPRAPAAEKP